MSNENNEVKIVCADPSALGLFGLAIVTLVASFQKLGVTEGLSFVIPWAVFLGAIAQLIAGMLDFKRNNAFGATAFCAFGVFWLGVATSWATQLGLFGEKFVGAIDAHQLGFAFLGYLIFSIYMTIGAVETHKVLLIIFICIDLLFIGLVVSTFVPDEGIVHGFKMFAGLSELAIAIFSFYGSAANVLNNHFGRVFLPVGKPMGVFKKG